MKDRSPMADATAGGSGIEVRGALRPGDEALLTPEALADLTTTNFRRLFRKAA